MNQKQQNLFEKLSVIPEIRALFSTRELNSMAEAILSGKRIGRQHASNMFVINETLKWTGAPAGWTDVFVETLTSHFLEDSSSLLYVSRSEMRRLFNKVFKDQEIDDTELELLVNLCATALATPDELKRLVMREIRTRVLKQGHISDHDVNLVNQLIYGAGGFGGVVTSREEAEYLYDLNKITLSMPNSAHWREFYIGALYWHILHDAGSPGRVDDAEAGWLIEKMTEPDNVDENTHELMRRIKERARRVPIYFEVALKSLQKSGKGESNGMPGM